MKINLWLGQVVGMSYRPGLECTHAHPPQKKENRMQSVLSTCSESLKHCLGFGMKINFNKKYSSRAKNLAHWMP